jgi:hypothetical protein
MSKTQIALEIYDRQEAKNLNAAAREAGIAPPTLFNALKRRAEQLAAGKEQCPCCGQIVRDGFKINPEVLK